MKKIILTLIFILMSVGYGSAVDYAANCSPQGTVGTDNYPCQICNGKMYDKGSKIGNTNKDYYKKCCDGTVYASGSKCCPTGGKTYKDGTKEKCCEAGEDALSTEDPNSPKCCGDGEFAYKNDNNKYKCCAVKALKANAGDYYVCCKQGEALNDDNKCAESCDGDTRYGNGLLGGGDKKCCPGDTSERYDYDSESKNYKKCCPGLVYSDTDTDIKESKSDPEGDNKYKCCEAGSVTIKASGKYICKACSSLSPLELSGLDTSIKANCNAVGDSGCIPYIDSDGVEQCCQGIVQTGSDGKATCVVNNYGDAGIGMNTQCLTNGQCSYNIYKTLGIRKSDPDPSVGGFVKDIVLAVTMFIGTVVSLILIVSGILYVLAGITGNTTLADKAKKGITGSVLGLILVVTSYSIVRLIQFLATAGGG